MSNDMAVFLSLNSSKSCFISSPRRPSSAQLPPPLPAVLAKQQSGALAPNAALEAAFGDDGDTPRVSNKPSSPVPDRSSRKVAAPVTPLANPALSAAQDFSSESCLFFIWLMEL